MSEERHHDRLRQILGGQVEHEVEDEVRFHLDMQVRDLIAAGWSPDAAGEEALRMFGDVNRVSGELRTLGKERQRRLRRREHLGELATDLRFAVRRIGKRPGFALVTVLVLALGIGSNVAIFGVVDAALLRPLPFPDGDAVIFLWDDQDGTPTPVSYPEFQDWQREGDFLRGIAAVYHSGVTLQAPQGPERLSAGVAGGDLLGVAELSAVAGRGLLPADAESGTHVAMLGEGFWRSRFGASSDVVGTTLDLNGESYEIVGVMPDEASILAETSDVEVWLPLIQREWMSRGLHFMRVVGRLSPGLSLAEAKARAEAMAAGLRESGVTRHGLSLQGVRERLVGDVRPLLLVLWGAVGFLLLIVCTNLANLFLSQASGRTREFAVRTALGAGKFRLTRQLLTESLLLGVLGGVVGLGLSRVAGGYVTEAAARAALLASPGVDWRMLAFTAGISMLTAVVFGLAPAARLMSRQIAADLKESAPGRVSGSRAVRRFARVLVGAEIALSVILLVGAGLMVTSMMRLLNQDPGFDPSRVISLEIDLPSNRYSEDEARVRFFDEILRRIRGLPGVTQAAAISHVPLSGSDTDGGFGIAGREYAPEESPNAQKRIATPGYFETMRIPLLRGRLFEEGDGREGREVAIVSEVLARRYWPGGDAVGERIRFSWGTDGEQEIVGVVGDVRHDGLDLPVEGTIYIPNALFAAEGLSLVVRTESDPIGILPAIKREVAAVDPRQPVHDIATLETIVGRSVTTRRVFMTLLAGFAALALLLAAVGVYAVTSGSVAGRTREIGVRLAMGAAPRKVLRMIVAEEMRVIVPGLLIGLVGALALSRTLRALLYQVTASDPRTFALVAAVLAVVALAAVLIPARRAAEMDPTEALRSE
jgi:putative ABC transport system permease protein